MTTRHALARAAERLGTALDAQTFEAIIARADAAAATASCDTAIRLHQVPSIIGIAWSDRSNGDTIVGIIRDNRVVTIMLRRSTQPHTPAAYNVRQVR